MNTHQHTPSSAVLPLSTGEVMGKQPLVHVAGPVDFMGQPPYDAHASIAAVRAYFAHATKN